MLKRCERYAEDAVFQSKENRRLGCNFTGPQWQDNPDYYISWCLSRGREEFREALKSRDYGLRQCREAIPSPYDGDTQGFPAR